MHKKKHIALIGLFIIGIVMYNISCTKDGDSTLVLGSKNSTKTDSINVTNASAVQNAISINNSSLTTGTLPASTTGNTNLSNGQSSTTVNSGGTLTLPIIYNSSNTVSSVYLQVVGANGQYYTVTPTIVTTSSGYSYISINMPSTLTNGTFTIQYKVKDSSGSISNLVSTTVTITDEVMSCSNTTKQGSSGLTFSNLNLGKTAGQVIIDYNTYSIPDRIDIYQGTEWLTGTGSNPNSPIPPMCDCSTPQDGFVGKSGQLTFYYNPSKGTNIVVVVSGCLKGGTSWMWTLTKAPACN